MTLLGLLTTSLIAMGEGWEDCNTLLEVVDLIT